MPTVDLNIHGNTHTLYCNAGEEDRLKILGTAFNTKLKQMAFSLEQYDDKTLYLITSLVLLDEADEKTHILSRPMSNYEDVLRAISDKILSIKQLLGAS